MFPVQMLTLNSLITTYAILDFMYRFKNIYKDQGLANRAKKHSVYR